MAKITKAGRPFDPSKPTLTGIAYPQVWKAYRDKVLAYEEAYIGGHRWVCPTCGGEDRIEKKASKQQFTAWNCSHIYPRACNYFLEWFPFNCIGQCGWCNVVGEGMVLSLLPELKKRDDMNIFARRVGFNTIVDLLQNAVKIKREMRREDIEAIHKMTIKQLLEFYRLYFLHYFRGEEEPSLQDEHKEYDDSNLAYLARS